MHPKERSNIPFFSVASFRFGIEVHFSAKCSRPRTPHSKDQLIQQPSTHTCIMSFSIYNPSILLLIKPLIEPLINSATTRKLSYCGGCKNCRYMSPIAARFCPTAVHEIYCGVLYARRNSSSILRRTTAVGQ